VSGQEPDGLPLSALTVASFMRWAAMRQRAAALGWGEGERVTAEQWASLRAMPDLRLNTTVPSPVNRTIGNVLREVRALLSPSSRLHYLHDLRVPPLTELHALDLALPVPRGHQSIEPADYAALWTAQQALHGQNPQLWAAITLMWRCGLRTEEVWSARGDWLDLSDPERPVLVVESRAQPAGGEDDPALSRLARTGLLKAGQSARPRRYALAPDLWAVLRDLYSPVSLLGCASIKEAKTLLERHANKWMRIYCPREKYGQHALYLLRHHCGQRVRDIYGVEMAAAFLGHTTGAYLRGERASTTELVYTALPQDLPALTAGDLAPR
jgi:integrase